MLLCPSLCAALLKVAFNTLRNLNEKHRSLGGKTVVFEISRNKNPHLPASFGLGHASMRLELQQMRDQNIKPN